ncbi:MAG: hypothetical protein QOF85_958 [Solirubrobacterales bacterium]|jgi:hypothetical protein|nr:hypothetical protein [Solirubrobacterales bacterium]
MPAGSPFPTPLTGPPSWLPLLVPAEDGEPGAEDESSFPNEHWPKLETVDYVNKLIVLIILLLALPWLFGKLLSHPSQVSHHAAAMAPVGA